MARSSFLDTQSLKYVVGSSVPLPLPDMFSRQEKTTHIILSLPTT
jgi:hypothetical protein